jgi:hypothetical protein
LFWRAEWQSAVAQHKVIAIGLVRFVATAQQVQQPAVVHVPITVELIVGNTATVLAQNHNQ